MGTSNLDTNQPVQEIGQWSDGTSSQRNSAPNEPFFPSDDFA
jgi:hypothetical protein